MDRIASNQIRQSWSNVALLSVCVLVAPSPLLAMRTVTLAWDPPSQTNIIGYHVYCGTASHRYTRVLAVGTDWATITDLVEGKTYFFSVSASNDQGLESPRSDELSFTVPPLPAGKYNGLFFESEGIRQESSGSFTLSVTSKGAYSGRVRIGGRRYPVSGRLDQHYRALRTLARPAASALTMQLDLGSADENDVIFGQVTDGTWTAALSGDRAVFRASRNPAPWRGRYTVVFPGSDGDVGVPSGDGFATLVVDGGGGVQLAGRLADGTKVTQSATLSRYGQWPFYASLYSTRGMALSWMAFKGNAAGDVAGALYWMKPPDSAARFYPTGFVQQCDLAGSAYHAPGPSGGSVLNFTNGVMVFSGGNLADEVTNAVIVRAARIRTAGNEPGFKVDYSARSGTFAGYTTDPATGAVLPFRGAVLQNRNQGCGYLLGTNQSSRVSLVPASN